MKTTILLISRAPVIGTLSSLAEMTEAEILQRSGPVPIVDDRFNYRPFFFIETGTRTHVFTGHEPETSWDAIKAAKRLFGKPVQEHTSFMARVEIRDPDSEGPTTLSSADSCEAQPELPLLW